MTRTLTKKKPKPDQIDVMVGHNVKKLRCLQRISQERLANDIGVTFQQIQKYEAGTNRISAGRLYQISQVLKTDISDLYTNCPIDQRETKLRNLYEGKENLELISLFHAIRDSHVKTDLLRLLRSFTKYQKAKD